MGRTIKRRNRHAWAAHCRRKAREPRGSKVRRCRECGCTEHNACITPSGPCFWVAPDLCSACELARQRPLPIETPIDPRDLARFADDGGRHEDHA